MELREGQQITVAFGNPEATFEAAMLGACDAAMVVTSTANPTCSVGDALKLHLSGGYRATATLASIERGPCAVLMLTSLQWEEARPRAPRKQLSYRANLNYLQEGEVKNTVGQTLDMSATGVRLKLRGPMAVGVTAHMVIHVTGEHVLDVFGKVRRIVAGSEAGSKGYDVAFSFERWVSGEQLLLSILYSAKKMEQARVASAETQDLDEEVADSPNPEVAA